MTSICPDMITEGGPSISIIDNDDFTNNTMTGGGTAHRCNWIFLQRVVRLVPEYEANIHDEQAHMKDTKTVTCTY